MAVTQLQKSKLAGVCRHGLKGLLLLIEQQRPKRLALAETQADVDVQHALQLSSDSDHTSLYTIHHDG